jgi:hypothetical protein
VVVVGHGRVRERPRIRVGLRMVYLLVPKIEMNPIRTGTPRFGIILTNPYDTHTDSGSRRIPPYGSILVGSPPPPSLVRWCSALQC